MEQGSVIWILKIILLTLLVLAVVLAVANRHKIQALWLATRKFLREVKVEMQRVSWPSRNDVIGSVIVVMTAVVILTLIITGWDEVLSWILHFVLPREGA